MSTNLAVRVGELSGENRLAFNQLAEILRHQEKWAIAFSGGVDSTLLFVVATLVCGRDNVLGLFGVSAFTPEREKQAARQLARDYHLNLQELPLSLSALSSVLPNPVDRCYHCKKLLFQTFLQAAEDRGYPLLAEGSNLDDLSDYRPGLKALAELAVRSPLREAQLTKQRIRALSEALGLPTAHQPSLACLATRIPTGRVITQEELKRVDAAEAFLIELGFNQVRVRHHEQLARIEIQADQMERFLASELRTRIEARFKELGFRYVTLDLGGYRRGSFNPPDWKRQIEEN